MEEDDSNPWAVGNLEEFLYFCCPECDERSQSEEDFLQHALLYHPKSQECLLPFTSSTELYEDDSYYQDIPIKTEIASDDENNAVIEEKCKVDVDIKPDLSSTLRQDNEAEGDGLANGKRSNQCNVCGKHFTTTKSLKRHVLVVHENPKKRTPKAVVDKLSKAKKKKIRHEEGPKERICDVCDAKFPTRNKLIEHKSIDHFENFPCKICGKVFKTHNHLQVHKKHVHIEEKNYQCDQCEKSYKNLGGLIGHRKTAHENVKFPCEKCGRIFSSKQHCMVHIRKVHEGENFNVHQCNICGKNFHSNTYLREHIESVHKKEKTYKCDKCDATFSFKTAVVSHMRFVHDNVRNYICGECGKAFKDRVSLNHHEDAVHKGIRKFVCKLCEKSYAHAEGLRRHMRSFHEGIRYECKHCTKSFTQENHLKSHFETAHGEKYIYAKKEDEDSTS